MSKSKLTVPYLQVVLPDGTPPDFTSPCPPGVDSTDWQFLWHSDEVRAGHYDWFIAHGGPFVPDAELKAQGKIPPDWSRVEEVIHALFGSPVTTRG